MEHSQWLQWILRDVGPVQIYYIHRQLTVQFEKELHIIYIILYDSVMWLHSSLRRK